MQKKTECTVNVNDGKVTITFDCNKNNDIAAIMAKALQMSGDTCNYKAVGKIDVPSEYTSQFLINTFNFSNF